MTSGGQCVMTSGTVLMLLWSASSLDMHTLEVSDSDGEGCDNQLLHPYTHTHTHTHTRTHTHTLLHCLHCVQVIGGSYIFSHS